MFGTGQNLTGKQMCCDVSNEFLFWLWKLEPVQDKLTPIPLDMTCLLKWKFYKLHQFGKSLRNIW